MKYLEKAPRKRHLGHPPRPNESSCLSKPYPPGPPPVCGPGLVRVAGYSRWVWTGAYSIGGLECRAATRLTKCAREVGCVPHVRMPARSGHAGGRGKRVVDGGAGGDHGEVRAGVPRYVQAGRGPAAGRGHGGDGLVSGPCAQAAGRCGAAARRGTPMASAVPEILAGLGHRPAPGVGGQRRVVREVHSRGDDGAPGCPRAASRVGAGRGPLQPVGARGAGGDERGDDRPLPGPRTRSRPAARQILDSGHGPAVLVDHRPQGR